MDIEPNGFIILGLTLVFCGMLVLLMSDRGGP